jgi:hypothetical protein
MTDEIDLSFLAEQSKRILSELAEARTERAEIRAELGEVRAEQHVLASHLGKVSDAVTVIAATQERQFEILEKLAEIQAAISAAVREELAKRK